MAGTPQNLPAIRDLSLQGQSLLGVNWEFDPRGQYVAGDIVIVPDGRIFRATTDSPIQHPVFGSDNPMPMDDLDNWEAIGGGVSTSPTSATGAWDAMASPVTLTQFNHAVSELTISFAVSNGTVADDADTIAGGVVISQEGYTGHSVAVTIGEAQTSGFVTISDLDTNREHDITISLPEVTLASANSADDDPANPPTMDARTILVVVNAATTPIGSWSATNVTTLTQFGSVTEYSFTLTTTGHLAKEIATDSYQVITDAFDLQDFLSSDDGQVAVVPTVDGSHFSGMQVTITGVDVDVLGAVSAAITAIPVMHTGRTDDGVDFTVPATDRSVTVVANLGSVAEGAWDVGSVSPDEIIQFSRVQPITIPLVLSNAELINPDAVAALVTATQGDTDLTVTFANNVVSVTGYNEDLSDPDDLAASDVVISLPAVAFKHVDRVGDTPDGTVAAANVTVPFIESTDVVSASWSVAPGTATSLNQFDYSVTSLTYLLTGENFQTTAAPVDIASAVNAIQGFVSLPVTATSVFNASGELTVTVAVTGFDAGSILPIEVFLPSVDLAHVHDDEDQVVAVAAADDFLVPIGANTDTVEGSWGSPDPASTLPGGDDTFSIFLSLTNADLVGTTVELAAAITVDQLASPDEFDDTAVQSVTAVTEGGVLTGYTVVIGGYRTFVSGNIDITLPAVAIKNILRSDAVADAMVPASSAVFIVQSDLYSGSWSDPNPSQFTQFQSADITPQMLLTTSGQGTDAAKILETSDDIAAGITVTQAGNASISFTYDHNPEDTSAVITVINADEDNASDIIINVPDISLYDIGDGSKQVQFVVLADTYTVSAVASDDLPSGSWDYPAESVDQFNFAVNELSATYTYSNVSRLVSDVPSTVTARQLGGSYAATFDAAVMNDTANNRIIIIADGYDLNGDGSIQIDLPVLEFQSTSRPSGSSDIDLTVPAETFTTDILPLNDGILDGTWSASTSSYTQYNGPETISWTFTTNSNSKIQGTAAAYATAFSPSQGSTALGDTAVISNDLSTLTLTVGNEDDGYANGYDDDISSRVNPGFFPVVSLAHNERTDDGVDVTTGASVTTGLVGFVAASTSPSFVNWVSGNSDPSFTQNGDATQFPLTLGLTDYSVIDIVGFANGITVTQGATDITADSSLSVNIVSGNLQVFVTDYPTTVATDIVISLPSVNLQDSARPSDDSEVDEVVAAFTQTIRAVAAVTEDIFYTGELPTRAAISHGYLIGAATDTPTVPLIKFDGDQDSVTLGALATPVGTTFTNEDTGAVFTYTDTSDIVVRIPISTPNLLNVPTGQSGDVQQTTTLRIDEPSGNTTTMEIIVIIPAIIRWMEGFDLTTASPAEFEDLIPVPGDGLGVYSASNGTTVIDTIVDWTLASGNEFAVNDVIINVGGINTGIACLFVPEGVHSTFPAQTASDYFITIPDGAPGAGGTVAGSAFAKSSPLWTSSTAFDGAPIPQSAQTFNWTGVIFWTNLVEFDNEYPLTIPASDT